jgi:hypothetical protein
MLGILFQNYFEFLKGAEHGHTHGHVNMSHIHGCFYQSLHTCFSRRFSGKPSPRFSGWYCSSLPIAIILTIFINSHLQQKLFWLYAHLCINDSIGTLASDFLPILNDYYTEITALVIGILFHIPLSFESSEGHKFNIAKVSMIVLGIALAYFYRKNFKKLIRRNIL